MINTYKTTNFHIAVWLMINKINLLDIEWSNKRADFVFQDFDGRDQLIQEFFKQDQIQSYISFSQNLKARMYANQPAKYE